MCMIRFEKEVPFHLKSMERVAPYKFCYIRWVFHPDLVIPIFVIS